MKKLSVIILFLTAICLTGCKSAPGGPYVIPVVLYLISAGFFFASYVSSKSKSTQQIPGVGIVETGNVSYWSTWPWKFGAALLAFAIYANITIYNDYRPYDPKKDGPMPTAPAPDGREAAEDQLKK